MINYQFFPKNTSIPEHLEEVVGVFKAKLSKIDSDSNTLPSNDVLSILEEGLTEKGYEVETGKTKADKIIIPVLHGVNGKIVKSFYADAFNSQFATVLEVEAGRAVTNYQFLKDLFQACMMEDVDYLVISVRNIYRAKNDFKSVNKFFDALYSSQRMKLPLKGILIIGY